MPIMIIRVFLEIWVISVIAVIILICIVLLISAILVMWVTSVTKVNLLMRIISVTRAVIRNKRKRIHEGLKISLMREISATSIVLMLMVISGKKKCLSNKGNKGNVSY